MSVFRRAPRVQEHSYQRDGPLRHRGRLNSLKIYIKVSALRSQQGDGRIAPLAFVREGKKKKLSNEDFSATREREKLTK